MQRTVLILVHFFICTISFAQLYPFVHYTPREGLVNNKAKLIFQDSKGKLYVGTFGGLSIYDGSRFTNFDINNGLGNNLINDIVEMGDDSVWVLVNSQKINYVVNGRLKTFIPADNFTPVINKLIKCSDGYYYAICDEGLFRLEDRKFIKIDLSGLPEGIEGISLNKAIEFDKKLFIVSDPGYKYNVGNLLVYDLIKKKLIAYKLRVNAILLFSPAKDQLWIATYSNFYIFNGLEGNNILVKPFPYLDHHFPEGIIPRFIYKDRQNNLWLTTELKGLYKIAPNGDITLFTKENGLTIDFQSSVLQDRENNMWFTNEYTGLCKLSNQQLVYYPEYKPGLTVNDISVTPSTDSVWLYDGDHGVAWLALPHGHSKKFSFRPLGGGRFLFAKKGFITSAYNIFWWDRNSGEQPVSLKPFYTDTLSGFTDALLDSNGNLITASTKIIAFIDGKILTESFDYMTDQFTLDKKNRIWVAPRSNKLFCVGISGHGNDAKLTLLKKFESITTNSPRSITTDRDGNLWIGTRGQGLFYFSLNGLNIRSVKNITTKDGLSENFIMRLFCDRDNNIWACSPTGLDKIKISNNNLLIENITKSNNLYFPASKVEQAANGMIWILTTAGIITYDPNRPAVTDWKPKIDFFDIVYSNKGENPIPGNRELKYFQNNLAFHLSAPTYIDEKQTRFSYMLEGSGNENWSEPSTNTSINFVNLSPGEYTLKAKAIFLHGLYPIVESSFSFTILPPWWLTWWFKSIVALVISGLVLLGVRFYIKRKLELQRVTLEKKQAIEKERTRIATDMHDDLGAGLSQIKFLSEAIGMKRQKHLSIEEEVSSIRSFSDEMIDKMGEIVWALNEKNDTLSDLLSYTRSYAVEYLEQNGIKCHVEEPDNIPQLNVSGEFRRNIYLTVKESLHNIVKHAQATRVSIDIEIGKWLMIKISDNGIGLDNSTPGEFGNGLISMKNRMKELGGSFEIVSKIGTEVRMKAPINH
ncbi:MAG TPA: two-component regulator propeller domain-containing protein [Chitinophagaceae bacterium]|nr:two-component regulator propeller domain-containing protein [Chitinophagaceae bacterium]